MIYVFDLDFTICEPKKKSDGGWDYLDAIPYSDRILKINELWKDGHTIIVDSARGQSGDSIIYDSTLKQLNEWGLKFHQLRIGGKFEADSYIDDKAINANQFFSSKLSHTLGAESGGNSKVFLVERVYKEAAADKIQKLADEIEYLEAVPSKFKSLFPKVIFKNIHASRAYYEMEHFNLPTLRRLILSNQISQSELTNWVDLSLDRLFALLKYDQIETPSDFHARLHFSRFNSRINEVRKKSKWLDEQFEKDFINLNGRSYRNFFHSLRKLENSSFLDTVKPEFVGRWSHSDLHFSNIIVNREKKAVVFIDPRGYPYCDYYYDYGKLWHSVNGKYEMIATRQFELGSGEFQLHKNSVFDFLESFKVPLMEIFAKYSTENVEVIRYKSEWNEVMHFASLIPFMIDEDGNDEKARAAFYVTTQITNEFFDKYEVD